MATIDQLAKTRDDLRKKQVRDRAKVKNLRDAIAALGKGIEKRHNHLSNLLKRIQKKKKQHPTDVSNNGLAFVTKHEGEVDHTYVDGAGNCTVGVGHLINYGACKSSKTISHDQAMNLLHSDAQVAVSAIKKYVTVDLNQNQFDALVDFVFNVGSGNFASSTLLRLLNDKNYTGAANQFGVWIYDSNHVAEPGLKTRRADERSLFLR